MSYRHVHASAPQRWAIPAPVRPWWRRALDSLRSIIAPKEGATR